MASRTPQEIVVHLRNMFIGIKFVLYAGYLTDKQKVDWLKERFEVMRGISSYEHD